MWQKSVAVNKIYNVGNFGKKIFKVLNLKILIHLKHELPRCLNQENVCYTYGETLAHFSIPTNLFSQNLNFKLQ